MPCHLLTRFLPALLFSVPLFCVSPCGLAQEDEVETESGTSQGAPDAPKAGSDEAELALSSFRKPDGWDVSLFAAEPQLANPVTFFIDNLGRVFVGESYRQGRGVTDNRSHNQQWLMADLAAQSVQDRIDYHRKLLPPEMLKEFTSHDDLIRLLRDTDGDGRADESQIFADDFNDLEEGTGAGILVRGNQAYYTCIPKLWLLTDADGDGRAEDREVLHDGYGVRVAFRGHDCHGLVLGPDGRLYFSIGDRGYNLRSEGEEFVNPESGAVFRCELDGSGLEVFATGLRNPQELAFDDYGYLFTGDNNSDSGDKARWVNVMQGGDSGWRMMYQYLPDRGPFNREKLWHPFSSETPAYIVPPIDNIGDGPSGLTCYPGTGLSGDFANCFFLVDFRGGAANSGIRLIRTQPQGAFWTVERSEQPIWNILATDADFGPDGALWVTDWVDGWIGEGKGRIYRFFDPTAAEQPIVAEVQQLLAEGFSERDTEQLVKWMQHPDRRIRLEAQWELASRGDLSPFAGLINDASLDTLPKLHAVWGIGHAARVYEASVEQSSELLAQALTDSDLNVRASAAAVVGDLGVKQLDDAILAAMSDAEPRVQFAAAIAAGKLRLEDALEPALKLLQSNADQDPGLRHAGIMALAGQEVEQLVRLHRHESSSVRLAAVVALRKLQDPRVVEFLSDADAAVQLETARAIHDVPQLHAALPSLARLELQHTHNEALVRRVLNANFRLGEPRGTELLGLVAADQAFSDTMRIEALNMLGNWATPGELDRVMNRYLPLADRDPAPAQKVFAGRLAQILVGSDEVIEAAIAASVALELKDAANYLERIVGDAEENPELRGSALVGLSKLHAAAALPLAKTLASDEEPLLRAQAIELLAELDPAAAMPALSMATQSEHSRERQAAWDALAQIELPESTALIEQGLQAYMSAELPPDVWLNVIEAAEGRVDTESIIALDEYEKQLAEDDTLAAYRDCLFGGDQRRGRELFFNKTELSCVRCHKVGQTGGEVGPALTDIAKTKDHRYLLEAIVDPDAKIAENFGTVVLLTEDDQVHTGILRQETDDTIELIDAQGVIIEVDPDEVVARRTGKSAMPADLIKFITRRELRDLVAYLASLK